MRSLIGLTFSRSPFDSLTPAFLSKLQSADFSPRWRLIALAPPRWARAADATRMRESSATFVGRMMWTPGRFGWDEYRSSTDATHQSCALGAQTAYHRNTERALLDSTGSTS